MTDTPPDLELSDLEPTPSPLAVPTRPAADGIIASTWGQWVHDETLRGLKIQAKTIAPAAFDANGLYTLTAATMGLATLDGCAWNLYNAPNNPTSQATQLIAGMAFRTNASTLILVGYAFNHPGGTVSRIGATSMTEIHVVAWGTAL